MDVLVFWLVDITRPEQPDVIVRKRTLPRDALQRHFDRIITNELIAKDALELGVGA